MKNEDRVRTQNDTVKFIVLLFPFFKELKIWSLQVDVVQGRQKKTWKERETV